MSCWELIDLFDPADEQAAISIDSAQVLRSALYRLSSLQPRLALLRNSEREMLALALLGAQAAAYWSPGAHALRDRIVRTATTPELAGTLVESETLLRLDDAVEIAVFVYNHRQLPVWVVACPEPRQKLAPRGRQQASDAICVLEKASEGPADEDNT